MNYYNISNTIHRVFWDNFQDNLFILKVFHQDTLNVMIDEELELVKRPVMIETAFCGYFPTDVEEDDDE